MPPQTVFRYLKQRPCRNFPLIEGLDVAVYRVPTDGPESDGTSLLGTILMWYVSMLSAGGAKGLGWTYAAPATAGIHCRHFA